MKQRIKQRKGLFNWFTILLVIIIGYFAVILVKQQIYLNQVSADQAAAEERLATARAEHEREELGMTRRGELPYSSGKSVGSR